MYMHIVYIQYTLCEVLNEVPTSISLTIWFPRTCIHSWQWEDNLNENYYILYSDIYTCQKLMHTANFQALTNKHAWTTTYCNYDIMTPRQRKVSLNTSPS